MGIEELVAEVKVEDGRRMMKYVRKRMGVMDPHLMEKMSKYPLIRKLNPGVEEDTKKMWGELAQVEREYAAFSTYLDDTSKTKMVLGFLMIAQANKEIKYTYEEDFVREYQTLKAYAKVVQQDIRPYDGWGPRKAPDRILKNLRMHAATMKKVMEGLKEALPAAYQAFRGANADFGA